MSVTTGYCQTIGLQRLIRKTITEELGPDGRVVKRTTVEEYGDYERMSYPWYPYPYPSEPVEPYKITWTTTSARSQP